MKEIIAVSGLQIKRIGNNFILNTGSQNEILFKIQATDEGNMQICSSENVKLYSKITSPVRVLSGMIISLGELLIFTELSAK